MSRSSAGSVRSSGQLALGVELRVGCRLANFVAAPDHPVVAALAGLLDGTTHRRIYLQGPLGSGKSHLLEAVCNAGSAQRAIYVPLARRARWSPDLVADISGLDLICVDDVHDIASDAAWERALFNLFNEADAAGCRLLIAARQPPAALSLPDLRSRLESMLRLTLAAPSDALKARILKSRANEFGFRLADDAISYLLAREKRDLHSLIAVLEGVDRFALSRKRRVNRALIRDYLQSAPAGDGER